MKTTFIKEKLKSLGTPVETIDLGFFDQIGEITAKRQRGPDSDLYKKVGSFYRANYERAILQAAFIGKYKLSSFLEIGFGRGYVTICNGAAMAMNNIAGRIITIDADPNAQEFFNKLRGVFPYDWHASTLFVLGKSTDVLKNVKDEFDLVYIDGDHTYDVVKQDWEWAKKHFKKFVVFDDYNEVSGNEHIQVKNLIDEIDSTNEFDLELIKMDRRIFFDDRRIPDEEINYGQVIVSRRN